MTAASIPLADTSGLSPLLRRTRLLRLGLAAVLVCAAVVAVVVTRGPRTGYGPFVVPGSSTVVVLDLSGSVELNKIQLAYSTLERLAHSGTRLALVVFSGYAYEVLPPGSAAANLLPIAGLFESPIRLGIGSNTYVLPPNPWTAGFSSGTEVSSGLALARSLIVRNHLRHPRVLLISDLLDDTADLPNVSSEGRAYRKLEIPLAIVGLDPTAGDLAYFVKAAGSQGSVVQPKPLDGAYRELRPGFPTTLAVVGCIIAFLLALNEFGFTRLRWHVPARTRGTAA